MGQPERRKNPRRATGEWGDLAFLCARSILDEPGAEVEPEHSDGGPANDADGCDVFVSLVNREFSRLTGRDEP